MGQDQSGYLPPNQHMTDYYGAVQDNPELNHDAPNADRHHHPHPNGHGDAGRWDDTHGASTVHNGTDRVIKLEDDGRGTDQEVNSPGT
jgi:uncharacterized cupin superfamily protein